VEIGERHDGERIEDIDVFRARLRDAGAIVIDPLTIDELRIEEDAQWQKLKNIEDFRKHQDLRWSLKNASVAAHSWRLQMLGFEVAESTVGKYMVRTRRPPSQGWKTFLRNHAAGIASLDLFVVRTISFRLLYGLVILRDARRLLVTVSVTTNPTAQWIAGQMTDAFPWDEAPHHLLRDRDRTFGLAYTRQVGGMGIGDHPVAARSPWHNGHVERVIGSIRRCLDHVVVFCETHLRRVLKTYAAYYNEIRTHLALGKDAPSFRPRQHVAKVAAHPVLGGLHHQYIRV
jgi:Integrase core domain